MFALNLGQIAEFVRGELQGDPKVMIYRAGNIQDGQAGSISFLANEKYEPHIYTTTCSAVLVSHNFQPKKHYATNLIIVKDPYAAFAELLEEYLRLTTFYKRGLESAIFMHKDVSYGEDVYIGAFAYIGKGTLIGNKVKIFPQTYIGDNVKIGSNTIIFPGAKILNNTQIGSFCTIHPGAVIGSQGFGFAPLPDGTYKSIPQVGNVVLKNHVSVGSNACIDCATTDSTIIEEGVKIDNLVQIGHNVRIGKHTVIAGQVGVAGSTVVGDYCMLGGQVGLAGHLTIADKTSFAAQSGLTHSIKEEGTTFMGSPAFKRGAYLKSAVVYRRLPELLKRIEKLEKKLAAKV